MPFTVSAIIDDDVDCPLCKFEIYRVSNRGSSTKIKEIIDNPSRSHQVVIPYPSDIHAQYSFITYTDGLNVNAIEYEFSFDCSNDISEDIQVIESTILKLPMLGWIPTVGIQIIGQKYYLINTMITHYNINFIFATMIMMVVVTFNQAMNMNCLITLYHHISHIRQLSKHIQLKDKLILLAIFVKRSI